MNPKTATILADSERIRELVHAEMVLTAAAYGLPMPDEAPSATFQDARRDAEASTGSRLTKFFAAAQAAMQQPPATILVMTEARLLALPEPLLAQVAGCEKSYAAGRWYIVTPASLWQSVTRLLGGRG